jgi:hypothetical protein
LNLDFFLLIHGSKHHHHLYHADRFIFVFCFKPTFLQSKNQTSAISDNDDSDMRPSELFQRPIRTPSGLGDEQNAVSPAPASPPPPALKLPADWNLTDTELSELNALMQGLRVAKVAKLAKADNVTVPMDRWVKVDTGEEITLQGFVGNSSNCPGVPVDHSRSSPSLKSWPDCLTDITLRPW